MRTKLSTGLPRLPANGLRFFRGERESSASTVQDPYERAFPNRHRPVRADHGPPDPPAAQITARIMTADDPDEIEWLGTQTPGSPSSRPEPTDPHRGLAVKCPRRPLLTGSPTGTSRHEASHVVAARQAQHLPEGVRHPEKQRPTPRWCPESRRGLFGRLRRRHH
ncbi:DUF6397 family protein [Streptomyces sp. TG1A-60]|uniref:DUF6397 family protein n=1 Tax=Streptomyces sp. TG1A-60 TaxID=3129111 RepID=UPI0030CB6312